MLGAVWKLFPFGGQLREKVGGLCTVTLVRANADRSLRSYACLPTNLRHAEAALLSGRLPPHDLNIGQPAGPNSCDGSILEVAALPGLRRSITSKHLCPYSGIQETA